MKKKIGIGLLGLGTVGSGVANILLDPSGRHPLVSDVELISVAVRDIERARNCQIPTEKLTTDPQEVVHDPSVEVVVEVMGGIEPARSLILEAIAAGKSVVTANKAVIARHGEEITSAANASGVYVLIEAAVGGGIPIIEPLKQSLGANKIQKISGIINGTTNFMLTKMARDGVDYKEVLKDAQRLGYAEANPSADVDGLDAADKIAILSGYAFGGTINRSAIPTEGIAGLNSIDLKYASQLGYQIKLLAIAERLQSSDSEGRSDSNSIPLAVSVQPTLIPIDHPLAGINGVNNAILIEGDPIGEVMFYGPGAGAGPTASAVVADILNVAGISLLGKTNKCLDPLLAASSWRKCHIANNADTEQKNYLRLKTEDTPGVIGQIGGLLGNQGISIQSIVQFDSSEKNAEIVVITHKVNQGSMQAALRSIEDLDEIKMISANLACL